MSINEQRKPHAEKLRGTTDGPYYVNTRYSWGWDVRCETSNYVSQSVETQRDAIDLCEQLNQGGGD